MAKFALDVVAAGQSLAEAIPDVTHGLQRTAQRAGSEEELRGAPGRRRFTLWSFEPYLIQASTQTNSLTDFTQRLSEALGQDYRIERELGGGGMSRVFLAEDVKLSRKVVVKVLPPEMAASVNQDRFRREIQLAARLQHPHVVPLLTANASGDLLWYVMPFIEGESLRAKLAREGELPVGETVRLLREVTDALAYAHEMGVVHRDIKPDNVMVSRGHALVTDFGVAKAVSESAGSASGLTSLGVALGTPAYMAPEQAAADPHVDHRADLYALGAVAYEMLAGRPPFTGASPQSLLMAHVTQAPDPISLHRPSVPAPLASLIMRCLEKRAADRWQSAAEIIPQLDASLTPGSGTQPTPVVAGTSSGTRAALRHVNPVRVTALFVAAAVAILGATWWLEWRLGLPSWVLPMAAVLMVIGLPIILLTAQRERERLHGTSEPATGGLRDRLFTWRGALGGGALALVGLATAAGGFMTLRAMGIGPFATLVSSGVLDERDKLVLADFTNRTSDSTLGTSITEAFRIDLTQSPVLRVAEGTEVASTLRLMGQNPDLALSEDAAHGVATRIGAKAVMIGEVTPLGSGYVLTARLIGVADSVTLLAERESASDAAGLIPAVEALSRKVREQIGESLRSVRAGQPLEQVTTRSLAALRAYSEGSRLFFSGARTEDALKFFEQAVALDSNFGMAWRRIGAIWNNRFDPARAVPALQRAYALRDQMPPLEAAHVTAFYYRNVENDPARAAQAYEQLLATWPEDLTAMNNLAVFVSDMGRKREAANLYRRALAVRPGTPLYLDNLIQTLVTLDEFQQADSLLDVRLVVDSANHRRVAYFRARIAAERGDYERAQEIIDSVAKIAPGFRRFANDLYMRQGRLRDVGPATPVWVLAVAEGIIRGNRAAARRMLDKRQAEVSWDSLPANDPRPYSELAAAFAVTGNADQADEVLRRQAGRITPEVMRRDGMRDYALALIAYERGNYRAALAGFRQARLGLRCFICTAFDEGRALEKLGQPDSAIAQYERFVNGHNTDAENREFFLAAALRRLGEMYESKGDRKKALEYYGRFVDLWKDADPELQPLVADVRKQMAQLAGEPPR
ncbi:MAG TPA: protein kinase [Gemmatimonadaceae bacterium]|nr:protein kinase [Gemmatimonadaceae bacterium]